MNITFYKTASDKRCLTKALSDAVSLDVNLKDATQYKPVVMEISKGQNIEDKNYAFIPAWAAYYYVSIKDFGNGSLRVTLELDVRMTFAGQIRGLRGTVTRNEYTHNGYLIDDKYLSVAYEEVVTKQFPNAMTQDSIILLTVG